MALDQSALTELLDALRSGGDLDFMREAMQLVLQALIDLEATQMIGAAHYERTDNRTTHRNGSRSRLLSTKAGDVELAIPKLRHGSFFPALLEPRRRIDRALWAVIMEAFVHGVSTRKVDDLVVALGIDAGVSKSQVSRICAELDVAVGEFRERRLDHVEFPYVFLDATYVKAHDGARVVSKAIVVATGVTADGNREVLDLAVGDSEDKAVLDVVPALPAGPRPGRRAPGHLRRPRGTAVLHRAGHDRLRLAALPGALHAERAGQGPPGLAGDGGRRHPHRLRPARRRRGGRPARLHRRQARSSVPAVETMLREAAVDICAFTAFPIAHWKKVWCTNPLERVNKEIKRRTNVVGIFPNEAGVLRLAGSILLEVHDEWQIAERRYLSEGSMAKLYETDNDGADTKEVGAKTKELLAG